MDEISMILLAGGKSSRMGSEKSDLLYQGQSFLEIQTAKAQQLGISDIIISGYQGTQQLGFPILPDTVAQRGPLGGLATCLRAIRNPQALVLSVDAPLVSVEELKNLIAFAAAAPQPAVIAQCAGQQYPLIGLYHASLADAMMEEIVQRKGSVFALLRRVGYGVYQSQADPFQFSNINDPDSYRKLAAF